MCNLKQRFHYLVEPLCVLNKKRFNYITHILQVILVTDLAIQDSLHVRQPEQPLGGMELQKKIGRTRSTASVKAV